MLKWKEKNTRNCSRIKRDRIRKRHLEKKATRESVSIRIQRNTEEKGNGISERTGVGLVVLVFR